MMKRFINILVTGLFFFTTTGFTVTRHYCGDNLISVAIDSTPVGCGMNGGCCHNESTLFQLKEDITLTQAVDLDTEFSFDIQAYQNELIILNPTEAFVSNSYLKYEIPPPDLSVYLAEIQSFRL